ncbi:uncharacterized protein LOC124187876 [Neodiprion fabricii]|uniref:uncharacterized protein LOC124187876 n=1 Tax=Neodiprion fabricii TaxID=2872261 RepID=UPI001ED8C767|nr:uncharacterized protein LOC124187876 [Neodiprion fabricii]
MHLLEDKVPKETELYGNNLRLNQNTRDSLTLEMNEDTDTEDDYPVRVSIDSTLECFVFLSFAKTWELSLVLVTITVYMMTTYEVFFEAEEEAEQRISLIINLLLDILYIVDICSSILHWRLEDIRTTRELKARSIFLILLDILGVVIGMPIRFLLDHSPEDEPIYIDFVSVIIPVLRMYRPINFFSQLTDMVGNVAIAITFATYIVIFLVTLHTYTCFWYLFSQCTVCGERWIVTISSSKKLTTNEPWEWYLVSLYFATCAMSSTGFGGITARNSMEQMYTLLMMVTGFVILVAAFIGSLTSGILEAVKRNTEFRNKLHLIAEILVQAKVSKDMRDGVIEFHKSFWKYKKAISASEMFADLPLTLQKEIYLDRYYLAFIRILSSDDNESSILNLTAGTILGDAALLLNIECKSQVVTATSCELQVVHKAALFAHNNVFHDIYVEMNRRVSDRLDYAKNRIVTFRAQENTVENALQDISLGYPSPRKPLKIFKNRLRKQQKTDHTICQINTYPLNPEFNPQVTVDMYVMATEAAVARYDICIKTGWPWILTPNTLFLTLWQSVIVFAVLVAAILYPYFACFKRYMTDDLLTIRVIIDILYILDIYVQISTAIDLTRDVLVEVKKITAMKIKQLRFLLDILAVFPAKEVAFYMSFYSNGRVGTIFLLNRVLKVHVVFRAISDLEKSLNVNIKIIRMAKYLLCLVFGSYWIGAIIYTQSCFYEKCVMGSWYDQILTQNSEANMIDSPVYLLSFYYALQVLSQTGYGDINASTLEEMITMLFFLVIGALLFNALVSDCSATLMLSTLDKVAYKEIVFVMKKFMEENDIPEVIQRRVYSYLDLQWQTDQGYKILNDIPLFADLSPNMNKRLLIAMHGEMLRSVPILQELNDETITDLANCVEIYVLPPGEIVSYAGEMYREFYIIQEGYCEAISVLTNRDKKTLGPKEFFGVMEMLLGKPSMQDIRSVTHLKLIRISHMSLQKILSSDKKSYERFSALIEVVRNSNLVRKLNFSRSALESQDFTDHLDISWIKFTKRRKHDVNIDYTRPFKDLGVLQFIQYMLMSRTITPNGPFIQFWEKCRMTSALLSGFIFPSLTYSSLQFRGIVWIALALDILAFLDIYIRLHVCYYNDEGLLISHPLSTAKHYLTHSFAIDLLGALPLYMVPHQPTIHPDGAKQISFSTNEITLLNKIVQLYRLPSPLLLYESNLARSSLTLNFFKFLPVAFIFINVLAALSIAFTCTYWERPDGTTYVEYSKESWIGHSENSFYFSMQNSINLYLTAVYWMVSTSYCIGFGDITAHDDKEMLYTALVIIVGYLMFTYIIVVVSSGKANVNRNLMLYQERMRHLVTFMKMERIPNVIQDRAIKHFENMWWRTHGIETHAIFNKFHHALRQDVMLQLYEQTISVVPAFAGVEKSFTRQLATSLEMLNFLKGSEIVKKNDIVSHMFIVHRGEVDVIGPDGTLFCKLRRGSIFGNIDNSPATRYMMTIVAAKHVDTLIISTTNFYDLARGYPSVKKQFNICVLQNMGYVPRFSDEEDTKERKKDSYKKAWFPVTYQRISLLKVPIAYLTSLLTSYQFSFTQTFVPLLFFAGLALDVLTLAMLFLAYNTEYHDDSGDIVDNITLIRARALQEMQFYLDALSIVPVEVLCLSATSSRIFWYKFLCMRRLLRARHLYLFFTKRYEKLNVNMLATKLASMISSFTLLLHILACVWYLIGCPTQCSPESWIVKSNCQYPYICSIYFIVAVVTTTGFGDIRPGTVKEIIFCSIMSVAMVPVVAMFMGDVSNVVQNYSYTLTKYDTAMSIMKDYLKDGQISYPLVEKALGYAKNLWLLERGCSQPALLAEAPASIREEIMVAAYGKHLFENNILRGCHEDLLRQLCGKMRRRLFFPTHFIVQEGDCNSTMYFIQRGAVEVLANLGPRMYTVCATLQAKEYFGLHQGFIPDISHTHTYRAATIVEVLTLRYEDWKDMLIYFPAAYRQIYTKLKTIIHHDYISEKIEHVSQHVGV